MSKAHSPSVDTELTRQNLASLTSLLHEVTQSMSTPVVATKIEEAGLLAMLISVIKDALAELQKKE